MAIDTSKNTRIRQIPPKVAAISDLSCFGRCSITVALPILAAMGVQCCPVPTAIYTNHTGYPSFSRTDFTEHLDDFIREWRKLKLRFDAISIGFLANMEQIAFVRRFLEAFRDDRTLVALDPIMGDDGSLYSGYGQDTAQAMRDILPLADIITPNLTEACILAGRVYNPSPSEEELADICGRLETGALRNIVITGIHHGEMLDNYVHVRDETPVLISERKIGGERCGTGDVFNSVMLGAFLNGHALPDAVRLGAAFTAKAVARTVSLNVPEPDGLAFEGILGELS